MGAKVSLYVWILKVGFKHLKQDAAFPYFRRMKKSRNPCISFPNHKFDWAPNRKSSKCIIGNLRSAYTTPLKILHGCKQHERHELKITKMMEDDDLRWGHLILAFHGKSGRKWPLLSGGRKWPLLASGREWLQVAAFLNSTLNATPLGCFVKGWSPVR